MKRFFVLMAFAALLAACATPSQTQMDQVVRAATISYQTLTAGRMTVLAALESGIISADQAKEQLNRQAEIRLALDASLIFGIIGAPALNSPAIAALKRTDDDARISLEKAIPAKNPGPD